jgi:hypothetical protein
MPLFSPKRESRFQPRKLSGSPQVRHGESVLWRTRGELRRWRVGAQVERSPRRLPNALVHIPESFRG